MKSSLSPAMAQRQMGGCLYITPGRWVPPAADQAAAVLLLACSGWALSAQHAHATDAKAPAAWAVKAVAQAAQHAIQRPESAPQGRQARLADGTRWMAEGRLIEATELFRALVREHPSWADAQNNLAVALAARGDYEGARHWLESAVRSDPDYAGAHQNLGDTYARLARLAYERALKLDRENPQLANRLAALQNAEARSGQPAAAPPKAPYAGPAEPSVTVVSSALVRVASTGSRHAEEAQDTRTLSEDHRAVTQAVQAWAKAWSRRDTGSYLKAYEPAYSPQGMERQQWAAQRRSSLASRARIDVRLENLRVSVDGDEALARFRQLYRSETDATRDEKVLQLRRNSAGQWLIAKELARPVPAAAPAVPATAHAVSAAAVRADTPKVPGAEVTPAGADGVRQAVDRWAAAWRSRDLNIYLSTYAADYAPQGMSRARWLAQREARIAGRQHIELKIDGLRVEVDGDRAVAAFVQTYRSGRIQSTEDKALWLQRAADGRWLIVKEAIGRVSLDGVQSPM